LKISFYLKEEDNMKNKKEIFDTVCEYLSSHPEIISDIISDYITKNYADVKDMKLGVSEDFVYDTKL
jgi:hypothetical protein